MAGKQVITGIKQGPSKKRRQYFQQPDNPIEIIKDLTASVAGSAVNDVLGGVAKTATEQFGFLPRKSGGELKPNEDLNLDNLRHPQEEAIPPFFPFERAFTRHVKEPLPREDSVLIQRKINEILQELRLLAKSVAKVNQTAKQVAMEETPPQPGIYHLNFFERLLKLIKDAREKVEESEVWLKLFQSRKREKQYWNMFKKHGTTFGLSQERVVATQTG